MALRCHRQCLGGYPPHARSGTSIYLTPPYTPIHIPTLQSSTPILPFRSSTLPFLPYLIPLLLILFSCLSYLILFPLPRTLPASALTTPYPYPTCTLLYSTLPPPQNCGANVIRLLTELRTKHSLPDGQVPQHTTTHHTPISTSYQCTLSHTFSIPPFNTRSHYTLQLALLIHHVSTTLILHPHSSLYTFS